ncbi:MAG: hypothetical protein AB7F23_07600 [Phycisphaerae bacterium]|jgi:hypothetical protein
MKNGKVIKVLLLCIVMFCAGYVTAVYHAKGSFDSPEGRDITAKVDELSVKIGEAAAVHGTKALELLRDQIDRMIAEKKDADTAEPAEETGGEDK